MSVTVSDVAGMNKIEAQDVIDYLKTKGEPVTGYTYQVSERLADEIEAIVKQVEPKRLSKHSRPRLLRADVRAALGLPELPAPRPVA